MIDHHRAMELAASDREFPLGPAEADALVAHRRSCAHCAAEGRLVAVDADAVVGLPMEDPPQNVRPSIVAGPAMSSSRGPISRRMFMLLAAGVMLLALAGGAVAGSLLRDADPTVADATPTPELVATGSPPPSGDPTPRATRSPLGSPSATASADASATAGAATPGPSATQPPAPPPVVAAEAWVEVITDRLNIRSAVGTSSPVLGTLERGDLAFSGPAADRVSRDGFDWTHLSVPGGPSGWTALHSDTVAFLSSDDVSGPVAFCGTPVRRPFDFDGSHPIPLAATIDFPDFEHILPTSIFSVEGLAVADLAWGESDKEVCVSVDVVRSQAVSGRMSGDFLACGRPTSGAVEDYLLYEPETGPLRMAGIHDVLFGYSLEQGNLEQLLLIAGAGHGSRSRAEACVDVAVSGGKEDSTVSAVFSASGCARVVAVDEAEVVLQGIAPWSTLDHTFTRHPGSTVAPEIVPGVTLGVSLEGDRGVDGPIRIGTAPVSGCG